MDQAQALQDILETVVFIKDHAASKEDIEQFATKADLEAFATNEDLANVKDEIMTKIDGFVVLHKRIEEEMVADRSNYDRIARQVEFIAKRMNLSLDGIV